MTDNGAAANIPERETDVTRRRGWYLWDVFLLGFLFAFGALVYTVPLFFYVGGLRNDLALPFGTVICVSMDTS
jgi:hypothetical protein